MAKSAPKIVARNFHEAHAFARDVLKLSRGSYRVVTSPASLVGVSGEVHLVPGWDKRADRWAMKQKLKYTRLTVIEHPIDAEPAEEQAMPEGWFPFGTHVDSGVELEFSDETGEDDLPLWERPAEPTNGDNMVAEGAPLFEVPQDLLQEIAEPDDKPAKEQEVTEDVEPEPAPGDEDNGVKEDDFDNDVEITQEVAADDDPDAEPVMDEHFGSMPMSDSDHAAQDDERPLNGRRRRRCKDCGELIHPDDVEEHAASEEAKKAALEKKAQENLR